MFSNWIRHLPFNTNNSSNPQRGCNNNVGWVEICVQFEAFLRNAKTNPEVVINVTNKCCFIILWKIAFTIIFSIIIITKWWHFLVPAPFTYLFDYTALIFSRTILQSNFKFKLTVFIQRQKHISTGRLRVQTINFQGFLTLYELKPMQWLNKHWRFSEANFY